MNKINTYILTGFLGAGKTTLLNYLLKQVESLNNLVIENEFGKINIDSRLIKENYTGLYEITNGCICCTYDEGFFDLLNDIVINKKDAQNLFIETSGVADVSPVISLFNREDVKQHFELINTICVCDAETIEDHIQEFDEPLNQITQADILVINKSSRVGKTYLDELKLLLHQYNCFAQILTTADGFIDIKEIKKYSYNTKISGKQPNSIKIKHKIKSILYETTSLIDVNKIRYILGVSLIIHYKQILRIKGYFKACDNKSYFIQSAGKSLCIDPVENFSLDKNQLVFLVNGVETASINRIMNQTFFNNKINENESSLHF